jgi:hypothetical protein
MSPETEPASRAPSILSPQNLRKQPAMLGAALLVPSLHF